MNKKKRVVLCTYHGLVSSTVLANLLACSSIEVVGIVRSIRLFSTRYNTLTGSIKMIRASGWRYSIYLFLLTDFYHFISPISRLKSLDSQAKQQVIPLYKTKDINTDESVQWIKSLAPDYLLSAYFNQKINPNVLQIPLVDSFNIHPALLPSFQGVDPFFYLLLRGVKHGGVSLHQMNERFDEGPLVSSCDINVSANNNVMDLTVKSYQIGTQLFCELVDSNSRRSHKTKGLKANYDSWPTPELVDTFFSLSLKLWTFSSFFSHINKKK